MIINLAFLLVKIPCNHQSGTKLLHVVLALSSERQPRVNAECSKSILDTNSRQRYIIDQLQAPSTNTSGWTGMHHKDISMRL